MYVTDTHPLVCWITQDYRRLSRKVKDIFDSAVNQRSNALIVPAAVLWEISLKAKSDPDLFPLLVVFEEFVDRLFSIPTIIEAPVTKEIVALSHNLNFHKDPFDTIIVATAIEMESPLITNDSIIHKAKPCELIWD